MSTSEKRFLLILFFSIVLHAGILVVFSLSFQKPDENENRVEINLNNYQLPRDTPIEQPVEPEKMTRLNFNQIEIPKDNVQPEKIKRVKRILKERVTDYSELAKLPENIPQNYPLPQPVVTHKPAKKPLRHPAPAVAGNPHLLSIYLRRVRGIIESHKMYPLSAKENGVEGKVLLEFTLLRNGNIASLRILRSSGSDALDRAAKRAILDSVPFPPFPAGVKRKRLHVKLYIVFKLEEEDEW